MFNNNKFPENLELIYQNEIKENIEIDLTYNNLIIKSSDSFEIKTNNEKIKIIRIDDNLYIKENKNFFLNFNNNSQLVIYIPRNYEFKNFKLLSGTGKVKIDVINSLNTTLDLGSGEIQIDNINSLNSTNINGGIGYINIRDGYMNNLNLDLGIGRTDITSNLGNNCEINIGIGELNLNLINSINNYKIIANTGIGNVKINDEKIKNDIYYGSGKKIITIDGGIGSMNIVSR